MLFELVHSDLFGWSMKLGNRFSFNALWQRVKLELIGIQLNLGLFKLLFAVEFQKFLDRAIDILPFSEIHLLV